MAAKYAKFCEADYYSRNHLYGQFGISKLSQSDAQLIIDGLISPTVEYS